MAQCILMRHGQSLWNQQNLFTGWVDVPLSLQGMVEAKKGGEKMAHIPFSIAFTSGLIRAQMTAIIALLEHSSGKTPVIRHEEGGERESWGEIHSEVAKQFIVPLIAHDALNERMYGALQGCNKKEMAEKYGADLVQRWRRSYDESPPEGESLAMTAARTVPYFQRRILPHLMRGETLLIVAHGNSLRSIIMYMEGLSKEEVLKLEIPLGEPLVYRYGEGSFQRESFSS